MEETHITHTPKSSNIHSFSYDPATSKLTVHFKDKDGKPTSSYEYSGVTPNEHAAFINAHSHGGHFAAHIKPKFKGKKL